MDCRMGDERRQWVQRHADRLLQHWRRGASPFEVAVDYRRQLERDLAAWYDQPLLRTFVERSY